MTLIARNSGGYNVIGRPQSIRPWYPTNRVRPVRVEVFFRYADEVAAAARSLGTYAPGQAVRLTYNAVNNRTVIFSIVTISPNGMRSVRELADALEVEHTFVPKPLVIDAAESATPAAPPPTLTVPTGIRYPDTRPDLPPGRAAWRLG